MNNQITQLITLEYDWCPNEDENIPLHQFKNSSPYASVFYAMLSFGEELQQANNAVKAISNLNSRSIISLTDPLDMAF